MNGKGHLWTFLIGWSLLFILNLWLNYFYWRTLFAAILLPFLNPDFDQALDPESHRWFFTHSMIPATLFWLCIQPALGEFSINILFIFYAFPWLHLIADLGGVQGFGLITVFPRLHRKALKKFRYRTGYIPPKEDRAWEVNFGDISYHRLGRKGSYAWLIVNILLPLILGVIVF